MKRAYAPRMATVDLMAEIKALDGIARVRAIAPTAGKPTRLRITLDANDPNGRPVYSDFTLPEARAWLAAERAYTARPLTSQRIAVGGAYR